MLVNQTVVNFKNTREFAPIAQIFFGDGTHNVKKWCKYFTFRILLLRRVVMVIALLCFTRWRHCSEAACCQCTIVSGSYAHRCWEEVQKISCATSCCTRYVLVKGRCFHGFEHPFIVVQLLFYGAQCVLSRRLKVVSDRLVYRFAQQSGTGAASYSHLHILPNVVVTFVEHHHFVLFGSSAQLFATTF